MRARRGEVSVWSVAVFCLVFLGTGRPPLAAQATPAQSAAIAAPTTAPVLSAQAQEVFLQKAKVLNTRPAGKGVTGTLRATLSDGTVTHDASIQTVDIFMQEFKSRDKVEFNFTDSWRYNVAAYRLNRVLQLGQIPVSVEREFRGKPGAYTWWVDEVLMDEGARLKDKAQAPSAEAWNRQMWHVRVFDQLIYNVDRNLGNLLIDKDWGVWMIDHSRAFRVFNKVKSPADVRKIERTAFERLRQLDKASLDAAVGDYLLSGEKRGLLQRRDEILKLIEKIGPAAFFDAAPATAR